MGMDGYSTQVTNILATLQAKGFNTSQTMEISGGGGQIQPLKELVEAIVKEIYNQLTTKATVGPGGTHTFDGSGSHTHALGEIQ